MKNDSIYKEGYASYKEKFETVGGELFLSPTKLKFRPHSLNFNRKNIDIDLLQVKFISKKWNKLFGIFPIAPNMIQVTLENNKTYKFIVWKRDEWIQMIQKIRFNLC